MKKGDKVIVILVSLTLIVSVVIGFMTRQSYYDDTDFDKAVKNIDSFDVKLEPISLFPEDPFLGTLGKQYGQEDINNFSELQDKSDLIVKVIPTHDRKVLLQTILSRVKVLNVYKGKDIIAGDNIYVYEPCSILYKKKNMVTYGVFRPSYTSYDGYILMRKGKEYILFLKKLKAPKGYRYRGKEKMSYVLTSMTFGKYPVQAYGHTEVIEEDRVNPSIADKTIKFAEIKDMDLIAIRTKILKKYNEMKEQLIAQGMIRTVR